ncbi:MAG: DUF1552 domain-containing protein [Myxococcales bacterium]|nr:DUF1552 domain-containing protein [Myxococcales bacterium]
MKTSDKAKPTRQVRNVALPRRLFLKGAASTIWLPALEGMLNSNGNAYANGDALAKRFVEVYFGVSYSKRDGSKTTWAPRNGSGPLPAQLNFEFTTDDAYQAKIKRLISKGQYGLRQKDLMNSISDPAIKKYVRIIDGISTSGLAQSNQHGQCMKSVVGVLPGYQKMTNNAPSVATLDRYVASYDKFRSGTTDVAFLACSPAGRQTSTIEFKSSCYFSGTKNGLIPGGSSLQKPEAEFDPAAAFAALFGNGGANQPAPGANDPAKDRRRSVLNGVLKANESVLNRLSGADKQEVEAHLDYISEIEKSLTSTKPLSCDTPDKPETAKKNGSWDLAYANGIAPRVAKDMRDIAVLMLKCGYTQVVNLVITPAWGNINASYFIDHTGGKDLDAAPDGKRQQHPDSHDFRSTHALLTPYHTGQLASLIKQLADVKEGAQSLIDETLIWFTSEHGPQTHDQSNIATVIAGGPSLVKGDYYDDVGSRRIADLHMGILASLGLPDAQYRDYVKSPQPSPVSFL